jgi:hypothetical protein
MILGALLARLENEAEAAAAIEALGDIVLFQRVRDAGQRFDETPGEYVACAASRFAAAAQHEEWMGLIAAVERADDPGRAALGRIVAWALARDTEDVGACGETGNCTCA